MTNWYALNKNGEVMDGQPVKGFPTYIQAYKFASESGEPDWSVYRQD